MGLEKVNVQPEIEGFDVFWGMERFEIAMVRLEKDGRNSKIEPTIEGFDVFMGKEINEIAHVGLEKGCAKFSVTVSMKKLRIGRQIQTATEIAYSTVENRREQSLVVQKMKVVMDRPVVDGIATIDHQKLRRLINGGVLLIV